MAGSVTIQGLLTGTTSGTQYIGPFTLPMNTAGNFSVTEITLGSGVNLITVPPWAGTMIVVPPTTNTQTLGIIGTTSPLTGLINLSPSSPSLISIGVDLNSSLNLESGGATTGTTAIIFF